MKEVWENIYSNGHQCNLYPWDCVVSFLNRNCSLRGTGIGGMKVLEIGCGTGGNLWFAAREGAQVCGTDFSRSAIDYAINRFNIDGLSGDFLAATLPDVPNFGIGLFDFIIDRSCLTHCSHQVIRDTHKNLRKLLKPEGLFFSTVYGSSHMSAGSGERQSNGLTAGICKGSLTEVGLVSFFDAEMINEIWSENWKIEKLMERRDTICVGTEIGTNSEWHVTSMAV